MPCQVGYQASREVPERIRLPKSPGEEKPEKKDERDVPPNTTRECMNQMAHDRERRRRRGEAGKEVRWGPRSAAPAVKPEGHRDGYRQTTGGLRAVPWWGDYRREWQKPVIGAGEAHRSTPMDMEQAKAQKRKGSRGHAPKRGESQERGQQ